MSTLGDNTRTRSALVYRSTETLLQRLTDHQVLKDKYAQLTASEIINLATVVKNIFRREDSCLRLSLDSNVIVIGDTFAHYGHLLRIFYLNGFPPYRTYIFLGNFIDRGHKNLETITLLYCLKIRFPNNIYILRGSHECSVISREYGFLDECNKRFPQKVWEALVSSFEYLPCCAVLNNKIFLVHSGLSPNFQYSRIYKLSDLVSYINTNIVRPVKNSSNQLLMQLIWSQPSPFAKSWEPSPTGQVLLYGSSVVEEFVEKYSLDLVIRSNEFLFGGFEYFANRKLLSIFSVPNFMNTYRNNGVIVFFSKTSDDLRPINHKLLQIKAIGHFRKKPTSKMNLALEVIRDGFVDLKSPLLEFEN